MAVGVDVLSVLDILAAAAGPIDWASVRRARDQATTTTGCQPSSFSNASF
jgi:hypothetical protein